MKHIPFLYLLACLLFSVTLGGQTTFYKLYGNADDNYPQKVKGFNGFTYVLASRKDAMTEYATFTKFTGAGAIVWERQLDFPSQLLDFEYSPSDQSFLLVGRTEPFIVGGVVQDNQSVLVKIDDNGTQVFVQKFAHTGRESFMRIIRHTSALPAGTASEFYVLGFKNQSLPASSSDQVMLYNFDQTGAWRFAREYFYTFELEGYLGLFQKANGNVVFLGDAAPFNDGILVEVNGVNGSVVSANKYNQAGNTAQYDFHDGMELPNGQIVVAGTDFGNKKGMLVKLNSTYAPMYGRVFDNISEFRELGRDPNTGPLSALLYVIGPAKQTPDYTIVSRVTDNFTTDFTVVYSAYQARFETDFKNAHFSVTPASNRIFYADSREVTAGNFDMLVGAFDLNFSIQNIQNTCRDPFTNPTTPVLPVRTAIQVTDGPLAQNVVTAGKIVALAMPLRNFCTSECSAALLCTVGQCLDVQCTGTGTSSGIGPVIYSWDFNNDGIPDASGANLTSVNHTYPAPGTYIICLTISDASINCSTTSCQTVVIPPVSPPACIGPPNVILPTDPGKCTAFYAPTISGFDPCGPVTVSSVLTGATTGNAVATNYNKGITTVTSTVTGIFNNSATCSFTVTVVDAEPPKITCPQSVSTSAPFCNGGAIVSFPAPVVTDNCPMATYTCTQQSGSFFPCGQTTVTCTATDMGQNTSTCSFNVNVDCKCAEIGQTSIMCDPVVDDKYLFTIPVTSLNGATSCTATVTGTGQTGVVVTSGSVTFSGSGVLTGMITATNPIPATFNLVVNVQCICPNGQVSNCMLPVSLVPICCKHIYLKDTSVCATDQQLSVPIIGCGQFTNIQQVNWYVATGPSCPPFTGPGSPGWTLQQGQFDCSPLLLSPYLYTNNIWVQVTMTVGDFPCKTVPSNVACVTLCQPVSCTIMPALQEFCFTGTPITPPSDLTVNPVAGNCPPISITWSGPGVPAGQMGPNYLPTGLTTSNPAPCYEDFVYTATVKSLCGDQQCSATIRLYNDGASVGMLDMNPVESPVPYCPGEDFTLEFKPGCASHPPAPNMWTWWVSTISANSGFVQVPGSGTMNPLWNTNPVWTDTWYQVNAQNGVCPPKPVTYFLDIRDPLTIGTFTVTPILTTPDCDILSLDLAIPFSPADPNCPIKVTWIKNGQVLFVGTYTSSPATWNYSDPLLLGDYSGNYWVIVESTCCQERQTSNLVPIDPPCYTKLTGPCFLRPGETVTLTGMLVNPMPFVICDDYWFIIDNTGNLSTISSNSSVQVSTPGYYVYKVYCDNGCIKCDTFPLDFCDLDCIDATGDSGEKAYAVSLQPNPNTGAFTLTLPEPAPPGMVFRLLDLTGRLVQEMPAETGFAQQSVHAAGLPSGMYWVQVISDYRVLAVKRFVKE